MLFFTYVLPKVIVKMELSRALASCDDIRKKCVEPVAIFFKTPNGLARFLALSDEFERQVTTGWNNMITINRLAKVDPETMYITQRSGLERSGYGGARCHPGVYY